MRLRASRKADGQERQHFWRRDADASLVARLGLRGFLALAVGGIGSNKGCLVGGLFPGLLNSFTPDLFGTQYQNAVSLSVLSFVLVIRLQGVWRAQAVTAAVRGRK
jgi:branched-subunit amino acid ABC-type transport system permease component